MAKLETWESELNNIVFEYLKNGRPNWDIPHTKSVVYWAKAICKSEKCTENDTKIIVSAAYLHDIGYSFTGVKAKYDSVLRAKADHMVIGAKETKKILSSINEYTKKEIEEITLIVEKHDLMNRIFSKNEQILIEADSLAQLDRIRVKPSFNQMDYDKFITDFEKDRIPIIRTKAGRKILKELWPVAKNYQIN